MNEPNFEHIGRGVEVLVKKASVDPAFRDLLLEKRADAADEIELALDPAEAMMLDAVTAPQLEAIIARTTVPQEHRRAFLGKAAVAMLATLGAMGTGLASAREQQIQGIRPSEPTSRGARPDRPPEPGPTLLQRQVMAVIAEQMKIPEGAIGIHNSLVDELKITGLRREAIRAALARRYQITIPTADFAKLKTVGEVAALVEAAIDVEPQVLAIIADQLKIDAKQLKPMASLAGDLKVTSAQRAKLRTELIRTFRVHLPWEPFRQLGTVGELVELVSKAVERRREAATTHPQPPVVRFGIQVDPRPTRGVRPDRIPPPTGSRPDLPPPR